MELYYIAFLALMSSRQMGMSAGPIAWTTIEDYSVKNRFDEEQTEALHHHINKMDLIYLKHNAKK